MVIQAVYPTHTSTKKMCQLSSNKDSVAAAGFPWADTIMFQQVKTKHVKTRRKILRITNILLAAVAQQTESSFGINKGHKGKKQERFRRYTVEGEYPSTTMMNAKFLSRDGGG